MFNNQITLYMRKVLTSTSLIVLVLFFFSSCQNQKKAGFTIDIHFKNLKPETEILLQKRQNGQWIKLDSTTLKEGQGSLTGDVKSPELYYLTLQKFNVYIPIWVENSHITVDAGLNSLSHPTIKGSKVQDQYYAFLDSTRQFSSKEKELGQQYRDARMKKEEDKMKAIESAYDSLQNKKIEYLIGYAERHNNSVISPYIVMSNSFALTLPQLEKVTSSFGPSLAQNEYVKYLTNRVNTLKRVAVGQPFLNFTQDNPEGKPVSLESVVKKNKYTLVDFWASWCMPCRAENPNVVKAYKTFHKKGFTVFGVSLDKSHDNWVKAIKKDGLDWTQVSDLKFWNSAAAKLYGVQSIPHNVLIGPDGKIVAKNLRGEKLQDTLKKLLK
jgi:peroxiredoxin